jgi:hypothetical protein
MVSKGTFPGTVPSPRAGHQIQCRIEGEVNVIPCADVIEQLWDYLDGRLHDGQAVGIREHLRGCANCRAVSEFEQSFLRTVGGLLDQPVPDPELRARVVAALAARGYKNRG